MAATDIKISQMTPATTLAGDELIPIVQMVLTNQLLLIR